MSAGRSPTDPLLSLATYLKGKRCFIKTENFSKKVKVWKLEMAPHVCWPGHLPKLLQESEKAAEHVKCTLLLEERFSYI